MKHRIDVETHLTKLIGSSISTVTGRPNKLLGVSAGEVLVGTERSPEGRPVPLQDVQDAFDRLMDEGEIEISVESLGYRSAFLGAALLALPGAVAAPENPPRIRLTV